MKKIIAGLGIFSLAFVLTGVADAAMIKNIKDSSSSTVTLSHLIKVLMLNNNNTADITNASVTSTANSGANSFTSADDQSGSTLMTGATEAATLADNGANTNILAEEVESAVDDPHVVDGVDDSSSGDIDQSDEINNDMTNNNDVDVDNDVDADADSGTNAATSGDSLTATSFTTGKSVAATGTATLVNSNLKDIIRKAVFRP